MRSVFAKLEPEKVLWPWKTLVFSVGTNAGTDAWRMLGNLDLPCERLCVLFSLLNKIPVPV